MNILIYNIGKISILVLMTGVSSFLLGQSVTVDSLSGSYVSGDTAVSENITEMPEIKVEKAPENVSPAAAIPMNIPSAKPLDFILDSKYNNIRNVSGYAVPQIDTVKPDFNLYFSTNINRNIYYNRGKLYLNLNLDPPKSIINLIRENPLRALIYGVATFAGMMNNTIVGEDKMNKIRLDNMVQSHTGIPETMVSGQGTVFYEIDIKKK
ncbi:MAG: hypothetical protein LBH60_02685 [Prevotellaceae bacterium]|nr:hypothetical protein [Prevotellaceae bacterium]